MSLETREFHSRLQEFPLELRCKLAEIPYQKGMLASNRKKMAYDLLKEYKIDFLECGTGTNRFIIKYDGYAVKIALDNEGIADNKQEYVMSNVLGNVARAYEILSGGQLLVADYAPAFTAYHEMMAYRDEITHILERWSKRFLLGDVGLSRVNYANWGLLKGHPVCIDYAYIFPASLNLFKCFCGSEDMSIIDGYTMYRCNKCGKRYEDREIRSRITAKERIKLFNDTEGFMMTEPVQQFEVEPQYIEESKNPDAPDRMETAGVLIERYNGIK